VGTPPPTETPKTPEQLATEKATADKAAADKKAADDAAAPKVPDKYEFSFKGEDGNPIQVDPETVTAFEPVLKKHGITQEALTALLPLYHAELARQDAAISELYTAQRDSWAAAAKADKEFGGMNYDANVKVAQAAMARFGTPAMRDLLNETGLGNHPELLKFFHKVGSKIGEDGHVSGGTAATGEADVARKLFDHPSSKNLS
jgi:hypothetical protein